MSMSSAFSLSAKVPVAKRATFKAAPLRAAAPARMAPMRITKRFVCKAAASEAIVTDVRTIIASQLGQDVGNIQADSKFVDLGADSLDTVEIMMALEEKFEITLDEEGAESITTVQEAADMIAAQM